MKSKSTVRPQTVTTPENVVRVSVPVQQSPKCSALKHTAALGLSEQGERRILHRHPQLQPYKIMVTEELKILKLTLCVREFFRTFLVTLFCYWTAGNPK